MSGPKRVQQQPAFVLHQRPFRDSSQLIDVLSLEHGRLALVARGSRSARSKLKGVLRPFLPLRMSWVLRSDLGTLTGAEVDGRPFALVGDALLSGYYVNELLLGFLHRHDPQPEIFAAYEHVMAGLAGDHDPAVSLRIFEIELLGLLGYAVTFEHEAGSRAPLASDRHYEYRVEQGPVPVERDSGAMVFSGAELSGIGARRFENDAVRRAAARLLRTVIDHHLGGRELKSRKVLQALHRAKLAPGQSETR